MLVLEGFVGIHWIVQLQLLQRYCDFILLGPKITADGNCCHEIKGHLLLGRKTMTKKGCPFHHRGLEHKSSKSIDTRRNRQVWPWSTKWSRVKAHRALPRERTSHNKYLLPTTPEKTLQMDITRRSIQKSDWLYSLEPKREKLCTVIKNNTRSWLSLRSWTPYCKIQT